MIEINVVICLLIAHFLGDFIFQSDRIALGKSKSITILTEHAVAYTAILFFAVFFFYVVDFIGDVVNPSTILYWVLINGAFHFITDYFTSKLNSELHKQESKHNFFVGIGFDQTIHYTTLVCTFSLIVK